LKEPPPLPLPPSEEMGFSINRVRHVVVENNQWRRQSNFSLC
jgi:hypothetical protein